MHCSVIWRPCLIKLIQLIERVQRCATKYILNDYISDYKSRLIKLQILPLAYILELNDIMFFICNLKHPHEGFNINNYISFASGDTRASANHKLQHNRSSTNTINISGSLGCGWVCLALASTHPCKMPNFSAQCTLLIIRWALGTASFVPICSTTWASE